MSVEEYFEEYRKRFKKGFPTYQLYRDREDSEVIDIIKACLKAGKDVNEMGLIEEDAEY